MKKFMLIMCVFSLLSGCGSTVPKSSGIQHTSPFALYEGLPHQGWDRELLEKELASKKTVRIHDYPFYERPMTVSDDDEKALRELCAAPDSFKPYGGEKKCGGYHPDYCIVWKDDKSTYEYLICFGCYEMKQFTSGKEVLVDIDNVAFAKFETILKKYRDQRPESRP